MANALPHREDEAREVAQLAEEGRALGLRALSSTTLRLAQAAVEGVLRATAASSPAEVVRELREVRADPALSRALEDDLAASQQAVEAALLEALNDGVDREMRFQVTQVEGLRWEQTPADESAARGYPILGHTAAEMSEFMHAGLRYEVSGALAGPLVGDSAVESTPQLVGDVVNRFGDRVASAVEEAYYAGVQQAVRMTARAVHRAR